MADDYLSPHFRLSEFASHDGRDFTPEAIENLRNQTQLLEIIRSAAGDKPIRIISGYRSPEHNAALRRKNPNVAENSQHMEGKGADFAIDGMSPIDSSKLITGLISQGSLPSGGLGVYPSWVHYDHRDGNARWGNPKPEYADRVSTIDDILRRPEQVGASPTTNGMSSMQYDDPTADAINMLPEVSRSSVDANTIASTMATADKLTSNGVTGSLTNPSDRFNNSTGSLAAEMIPTWQTAAKLLNPVNLLQLPMRALRMVDYTLRNAAGAPTLTDSAEQALGYINSGETILRDPTATARDAAQQELTTAKGLRGQVLSPAQKLVHIFTTDPFEGERQAMTAAQVFRARLAGQRELDAAMKGRTERDQKAKEAPIEIAQKEVALRKSRAELPFAGRKAEAEVRNLEALPEYRRQSLISQGLGIQRSMATMPGQDGRTPGQRLQDEWERRKRTEDMARADQNRADDIARHDADTKYQRDRYARQDQVAEDERINRAIALANKAPSVDAANVLLRNTPYMAQKAHWYGGVAIVPREDAGGEPTNPEAGAGLAPAATPTPMPSATPTVGGNAGGIDGIRGEIAAQVRAKFQAKMGRQPTKMELDEGVTYELNRRSGAR